MRFNRAAPFISSSTACIMKLLSKPPGLLVPCCVVPQVASSSCFPDQTLTTTLSTSVCMLFLNHKLSSGSSLIPRQSSMHPCCALACRETAPPCLLGLSLLKNWYPPTAALQLCKLSHNNIHVIPVSS